MGRAVGNANDVCLNLGEAEEREGGLGVPGNQRGGIVSTML